MTDLEVYQKMNAIEKIPQFSPMFSQDDQRTQGIVNHREWLHSIKRERPSTAKHFRIGIYIRYFNQTKYENYLAYHKKQFTDTVALCPNWTLVDFYIDEGAAAPNMESAPAWCRLLEDCMDGRIDLIITQKISNVSRKSHEISICARLLAQQKPPIGIYFISEDIFTLASYYLEDMRDTCFLPNADRKAELEDKEAAP